MLKRKTDRLGDWREIRRIRSIELMRKGWSKAKVAEAFDVSPAAVSKWSKLFESSGMKALRKKNRQGAPSRLSFEKLKLIPKFLSYGAESYGFRGELWTYARVAHVIGQEFNVHYHPHHVAKLMKILEWTPHKPSVRAEQRDEGEIKHWRSEVWPSLKKSHT